MVDPLVVVIDDDASVCRALARMLNVSGYRARTYVRATAYLAEADGIQAACVLADIRMPELDGIALARAMRAADIDAPVIFMTATGNVRTVVDAMKEGAVDLLPKPFSSAALLDAVERAVSSGQRTDDAHRALGALWQLVGRLTPREAEVCALVACGLPNKTVAARIGTTEKTVKVHRGRVMHKLNAPSLADLVRLVDRLLVEPDHIVLRIDGIDIARPLAVEVVIRHVALTRTGLEDQAVDRGVRS